MVDKLNCHFETKVLMKVHTETTATETATHENVLSPPPNQLHGHAIVLTHMFEVE